ncbi:hypothetical protein PIB30_055706 [Stylosanthes scabra]|uniref:Transposase n=1 Tax=Stylosanthes scabra TaxID=79078 RepID=A0ABU6WMI2_9FABA|nr:hypothetical protein [Stylosanthes scabra]
MWVYISKKFILPVGSKEWVMKKLCETWKKYKGEIKKNHFKKYRTKKQMLKNRPLDIPEVQFRELIRYWSLPSIKALSEKNIENRSKQTCPHRIGSTNFGVVQKELREAKENNEELTRVEMFKATRKSNKGKEVDTQTQTVINEIQHRIEAGENDEDAFIAVLGKDQPSRLRCYGGAITKSSQKKDEVIRQVKAEYEKEVLSLRKQMEGFSGLLKMMFQQLNPDMNEEDVAALVKAHQNSPTDASSRSANTPDPRSSESTHIPQQND